MQKDEMWREFDGLDRGPMTVVAICAVILVVAALAAGAGALLWLTR